MKLRFESSPVLPVVQQAETKSKLFIPLQEGGKEEEEEVSLELPSVAPSLPDIYTLPFRNFLKSREELEKVEWLATLHNYLLTLNKSVSPHLNVVNGDYKHRYVMENWIVAAVTKLNPPLHNVLVLSLDKQLCDYISSGNRTGSLDVTCIVASVNSTFSSEVGEYWITGTMTRPVTLSLINYWGYDVATYDSDAVLMKNPQELYEDHPNTHLISSASQWPGYLGNPWGFTLCTGAMLLRTSSAMGEGLLLFCVCLRCLFMCVCMPGA